MQLEAVFEHLSINELFRLSWGAKNTHGEAWEKLQADYQNRLDDMKQRSNQDELVETSGSLWFFPGSISRKFIIGL